MKKTNVKKSVAARRPAPVARKVPAKKPAAPATRKPASKRRFEIVNPFERYSLAQWLRGLVNIFAVAGVDFIASSIVMKKCLGLAQEMWSNPGHWCNKFMNANVAVLEVVIAVLMGFAVLLLVKVVRDIIVHSGRK
ncbi:MAG: hypothetical protein LBL52_02675 [Rickettsiales bacterium]|jgi:hypothetical protein|nr:hypothetical protein [Rickettsiales bacterium]